MPYTRAGCNVGGVATANIELENVGVDVDTVFGPNSPQHQEAQQNPPQTVRDFEGIAVHCAHGDATCSDANTAGPICCRASRAGTTATRPCTATSTSRP